MFGGKSIESAVIRPPYTDQGTSEASNPVDSVTFFSFPYLCLKEFQNKLINRGGLVHPTRTLIQTAYEFDSTSAREKQQIVNDAFGSSDSNVIHVPQIWCLILSSGTSLKTPVVWS